MHTKPAVLLFIGLLATIAQSASAQETYKCKIDGAFVYQDRPCPGAGRYSDNVPKPTKQQTSTAAISASEQVDVQRAKVDKDKAYIDERVKTRVFEREKSESAERIQNCEADAANLMAQADAVLHAPGRVYNNNLAGAMAAQADNQRQQTEVMALQAKATERRRHCDLMRQEHDRKFVDKK